MIIHKHNFFRTDQIRIIGGQWRSRKLTVLKSTGLRPTTDRIRETLFNWLTPVLQGAHCLDCFAGSGALGLEALSRGATSVILLEKSRAVSAQLTKNLQLLLALQAQVITIDSSLWIAQPGEKFNIIFIDPPFSQNLMINNTIFLLEQHHRLTNETWIYIESAIHKPSPIVPIYWQLYREKLAGKVVYRLYRRLTS